MPLDEANLEYQNALLLSILQQLNVMAVNQARPAPDLSRGTDARMTTFALANNTPTPIAKADPLRKALIFAYASGANPQVGINDSIATTGGITITSSFSLQLSEGQWGTLVQKQWLGFIGLGPSSVIVFEVWA